MAKKKPEAKLIKVTFQCPELQEPITVDAGTASWGGSSTPCELCGDHGEVHVWVKCTCKAAGHSISLGEW